VKWFKEERDKDKPFFVTFWFHEPHGPINADPRFTGLYKNLKDPSLRQFLGSITEIDTAVGTIVRCLKEEGVYEDTLIWYTSDNGPEGRTGLGTFNHTDSPYDGSRYRGSTGGLRGRKRHTHEGGIRVPGIICWPRGLREGGIRPGGLSGEPIIGSDVFPTFLEVAGLHLPQWVTLDGTSILPILRGKKFRRPRPLFWRNHFFQFRIASRDGDWKILGNSRRTKFELFNLRLDPRETTDLSAHEPERFERMKKALIAYDKEVLAEGPKWWRRDKKIAALIPPV
jgi:arylsulfatase A